MYSQKFPSPGRKAHHPAIPHWGLRRRLRGQSPAPLPASGGRPSSGPAAPLSEWAALCSPPPRAQLSPAPGQTMQLLRPLQTGWRPPQEERLLAGPGGLTPPLSVGNGERGGQFLDPHPGGLLEHPGWENEVGWRPPTDLRGLGSSRTGKALGWPLSLVFVHSLLSPSLFSQGEKLRLKPGAVTVRPGIPTPCLSFLARKRLCWGYFRGTPLKAPPLGGEL